VAVLGLIGRAIPWLDANLGAVVAVVFLYVPVLFAWKRNEDLYSYGFWVPSGDKTRLLVNRRGIAFGLGVPLAVFPLFAIGYVLFYDIVCSASVPAWLTRLAMPGQCARWDGWGDIAFPRLDLDFAELALVQLVVIALPEEVFFRGFLHKLLEQSLPPRRRILGGGIGWALVLSSLLFAIGHLAVNPDPRRLAVFFPGLVFGWMRSATGGILAGTIAHAASNLFIYLLERMFL
jgi:membrane protease YdiL (CAAX protease family)